MKRYALPGLLLLLAGCQKPGPGEAPAPAVPPAAAANSAAPPAAQPAPVASAAEPPSAAPKLAPPSTPGSIQVPGSAQPFLKAHAKGVQIYACGPKKDAPKELEWSLKAPEAELFDEQGKSLGKHFAGPTWQATDNSKVVGAMKAKVEAPSAGAVPWLLLEAKSNEGQGVFAHVSFVQRVDTEGGKAPATGCDKAHLKAETRVDYQANYYFYAP